MTDPTKPASVEAIHNLCTMYGMVARRIPVLDSGTGWTVTLKSNTRRAFGVGNHATAEQWLDHVEYWSKNWNEPDVLHPIPWCASKKP